MEKQFSVSSSPRVICWQVTIAVFLLLVAGGRLSAADPAFVGSLALAVEPDAIERLGLSEETVDKLRELIEQRENEAINVALEVRELPPLEQARRLAPFVAESERLGMTLLTVEQRSKLDQLGIQRAGMATLVEPKMVQLLELTDEQAQTIQQMVAERAQAMTQGGEDQRRVTRDVFERRLRSVLTDPQKATWDRLAGLGPGPASTEEVDARGEAVAEAQGVVQENAADQAPPSAEETVVPEDADVANPDDRPMADASDATVVQAETPPASETESPAEMPAETPAETPAELDTDSEASPSDQAVVGQPQTDPPSIQREEENGSAVGEPQLRFNFRFQPWEDVLDWLAEQADLSLQSDLIPEGTFNYSDNRSYSPTEAIDLINGVLLAKGYTLVRRGRLLTVINLEDEVPDVLVEFVPVEALDERGEFELIKTVFQLAKMAPADAQQEIQQLLGPGRNVVVMPKAGQIMVTETAGKMRAIRDILEKAENPPSQVEQRVTEIHLKNASAEEILMIARPLLGLGEGENVGDEISIAVDVMGTRLFATGDQEQLAVLQDVVDSVDVAADQTNGTASAALEQPQLLTHPIQVADPAGALAVMQTLLAGMPDVRLALDEKTNKIVALARPSEHRTIVETIKQLEGDEAQFEVIQLRRIDPQVAVLTISNFFGTGDEEGLSGIKVDADPTTMKLYVRATKSQLAQINDLVEKLESSGSSNSVGSNLRYVPLSGDAAVSTVEMAKRLWSGKNEIRFTTPSTSGPTNFDLREVSPDPNQPQNQPTQPPARPANAEPQPARPAGGGRPRVMPPRSDGNDRSAQRRRSSDSVFQLPVHLVSQTETGDESGAASTADPSDNDVAGPATEVEGQGAQGQGSQAEQDRDIRVEFTPEGVLIASDDTEALDAFEDLLRTIAGPQSLLPGKDFTVFFLKYSKAEVAQQLIQQILGGSSAAAGGSLVGDMASNLLGGGGILGALMGGGGDDQDATTIQASGPVSIVADPRLNCLVVQAVPADLQLIEQLLKVIDREASITDVETAGKPHIIPVVYMQAADVAQVVRETYADRIGGSSQSQGQRQPSPADFIRALRGGRDGRGGAEAAKSEEAKMTLSVDTRSNSLIVTAPEPLYLQVKELVTQIDQAGLDQVEDVQVVTLKRTNPEAIQKVLSSVLQNNSRGANGSASRSNPGQQAGASPATGGASPEDIQRRMEFIQQMRARAGGNPGGGRPTGNRGGGNRRGR